ncbi:MAG: 16S rRNA (guanine(966)-N(2))-methyltransferase RsmD [Pseudomonadota bacterium]
MRVISGIYKNKKLSCPKGQEVRPTSDKVKESLFNILGTRIQDKNIADCFAGSGALGIEALSRSASSCLFIEKQTEHLKYLKENIDNCDLNEKSIIVRLDIIKEAKTCAEILNKNNIHIVFADPPYIFTDFKRFLNIFEKIKTVELICFEHSSKLEIILPEFLELADYRKYGDTAISFIEPCRS